MFDNIFLYKFKARKLYTRMSRLNQFKKCLMSQDYYLVFTISL